MKLIIWTSEERTRVFEGFKKAYVNNPLTSTHDLIREAQKCLPKTRYRNVYTVFASTWFTKEFSKFMASRGFFPAAVTVPEPSEAVPKEAMASKRQRGKYVLWSKTQWNKFLKEFLRIHEQNPDDIVRVKIKQAQDIFEEPLRKDAINIQKTARFQTALKKFDQKQLRASTLSQSLAFVPTFTNVVSHVVDEVVEKEPAPIAFTPVAEPPPFPMEELVSRLVAALTPHIQTIINAELSSVQVQTAMDNAMVTYLTNLGITPPSAKPVTPAAPVAEVRKELPKQDRKKILLVGLLPIQLNEIRTEFFGLFDFVSWTAGENHMSALRSHCKSSYRVFGMIGFMSHAVTKNCSTHARERFVKVTGGVSNLKRAIEEQYCET